MTIQRLRELIEETHKHGVTLAAEIRLLRARKPFGWRTKVAVKTAHLRGLEVLNKRRRKELEKLEHPKPKPKPHPKPKPKPSPPPKRRFVMYDAVTVSAIPHDPEAVAGYVDGFANFDEMVRAFPRAKHLSIATNAAHDAGALDIEPGAAVPGDASGWVRRQHARGVKRPIVYAPEGMMSETLRGLEDNGIRRNEYLLWVAHWTGRAEIDPGYDAMQWLGNHDGYDESLCEGYFLP